MHFVAYGTLFVVSFQWVQEPFFALLADFSLVSADF